MAFLLQQTVTVATDSIDTIANATAEPVVEMSFFDMALKGGWIMIPLVLMLVLACYIFFERLFVIHGASKEDSSFMNRIKDYIYDGKIESALNLCQATNTPSARMIEKGISRLGRPMNDVLVAIENVGNMEVAKLEKGLSLLSAIAGGAPMIGFLGTVLGMVEAFFNMANKGDNTVNLSDLSGGIYTAMVTTVAGLIVGILAYFAYNYLVSRVSAVMRRLESSSMEFMDLLNEPSVK
ncbi:MAG: MotA/TolQ/ExbB proton channel family protein [Bacteroidales bacterium]|nr:MotA/TolQ/ExbB proton channel family protein [Bacteroidales bacterium]